MKLSLVHDHKLTSGVLGLALDSAGRRAFATCADGSLMEVDLASGKAEPFADKHQSYATGCVLLPDERTVITAGYDGILRWHNVATRTSWRQVIAHQFWSWQLALTPDGKHVASVTGQYVPGSWKYDPAPETEPSVKVFETATGNLVAGYTHTPPVQSCAFSPDGRHLAAANILGEVRVWELGAGAEPVSRWTSPDFTSWGTTKTHHFCGGIFGLAFAPDGETLLGCGMGPMGDPMAGNGKMTWQRWLWAKGEKRDQIKDGQRGNGLMESLAWHPSGAHFVMAGRQAQGTWNAALFAAGDGSLVTSVDTKKRITQARFTADGSQLILAGATAQGARKANGWEPWGRIQVHRVEA
jgi:WD40 repeat protein